ncbi:MAG: FAD-dependent oxidoreductase [Candidatus Yanofskybacteria bacterium]|nr:FAD-dependent oxidoreductase [Candidatus Yanofskybacteria bacterium]
MKARLAFRGSRLMRDYVEKNLSKEDYSNCGMLIAISRRDLVDNLVHDLPDLIHMIRRGRSQGISFRIVGPVGVNRIEPNIKALGGIFIPEVSIVNPVSVTESFSREAMSRGVQFFLDHQVTGINVRKDGYTVLAGGDEFSFRCLVNSAGLYSDEVSSMAGISGYKIYPWRGEYYELVGLPDDYVKTLVYPAVSKNSPGKGIHFRPSMGGKVLIGPSAKLVKSKDDYNCDRFPKEVFLRAAQKFFPCIEGENLVPAYAGIRPKLSENGLEEDFIISLDRNQPPLLNLIAIESPGLSSSMAIAEYAGNILAEAMV